MVLLTRSEYCKNFREILLTPLLALAHPESEGTLEIGWENDYNHRHHSLTIKSHQKLNYGHGKKYVVLEVRQKGSPCHGWNNFQRWNLCFQWGFSNSIWGIFINTRRCRGDTGLALRLSEHSEDTWRADKLSLNIFILLNICGGGGTLWPGQTQQHRAAQHSAGGRPADQQTSRPADLHCSLLTTPRVDGGWYPFLPTLLWPHTSSCIV